MCDTPTVSDRFGMMGIMRLESWQDTDEYFAMLVAANTPEMTRFLGGPESDDKLRERLTRYAGLADTGTGRMFGIRTDTGSGGSALAGSVGYWEREWLGTTVYEAGWVVLAAFQGHGLAVASVVAMMDEARAERRHRWVHAYPKVDHPASNGVCRKAGFELLGATGFEYPPGHPIRCNDWRFALWDE